jgi:hypothetical protein
MKSNGPRSAVPAQKGCARSLRSCIRQTEPFPAMADEDVLTQAFRSFVKHKDFELFKLVDLPISAKQAAKTTAKLLRGGVSLNRRAA